MGRGRAKAKQTKVARELKYSSPQTDFDRLQRELSGSGIDESGPLDDGDPNDGFSDDSWGDADDGLIERWDGLPEWPQMLLRALMFRLAIHALHPRSTADGFPGLARTAALVRLAL